MSPVSTSPDTSRPPRRTLPASERRGPNTAETAAVTIPSWFVRSASIKGSHRDCARAETSRATFLPRPECYNLSLLRFDTGPVCGARTAGKTRQAGPWPCLGWAGPPVMGGLWEGAQRGGDLVGGGERVVSSGDRFG